MRIHLIGIGGIGVSALAKYYLSQGHEISGSDLASSEITDQLQKMRVRVYIGPHKAANLCARPGLAHPDLVIYSPAISGDNPELKKAYQIQDTKYQIQVMSYPQALGELTKNHFTLAICGTHGKGTTTAMISLILIKAGLDPSVIIGTKLKEFGDSNYRLGHSKYLVIEADEYKDSFLNYWPRIIVLTTIDKDHLDYFKNLNNIIKTFRKFVGHLPKNGFLVANKNDPNTQKIVNAKYQIQNTRYKKREYSLDQSEVKKLRKALKIPGEHILADALAALTTARILKIPDKISFEALSQYKGAWRRFEITTAELRGTQRGTTRKITIVSDYAHHPTEVAVTMKAVRQKYPRKKICCVFQPHQYQRTYYLFKDFVKVFSEAKIDQLILTDIYSVAGRESPAIKRKVNSKKLVQAIVQNLKFIRQLADWNLDFKNVIYIPTLKETSQYLKKNLKGEEILVVMGAGDVYQLPLLLTNRERKGKMNNN